MTWLKWQPGRQDTGYFKLLLGQSKWLRFDLWLLRYPPGSYIPKHADPVPGYRHYRANYTVWFPRWGGNLVTGDNYLFASKRLCVFRSDIVPHEVTVNEGCGTRYVLSFGWLRKE